jgi:hypothetical protein
MKNLLAASLAECNDDFNPTEHQPLAVYWTSAGEIIVRRQAWADHDCVVTVPERSGR